MYHIKIMEDKDCPKELGERQFDNKGGKTVALLCRPTLPIHHTGKIVIMDSGFCVLQDLQELEKLGIYGTRVIKSGITGQKTLMER